MHRWITGTSRARIHPWLDDGMLRSGLTNGLLQSASQLGSSRLSRQGGIAMKLSLTIFLTILALGSTAFGAERIVLYEHFTAVW